MKNKYLFKKINNKNDVQICKFPKSIYLCAGFKMLYNE
jgi:hypothetical protein